MREQFTKVSVVGLGYIGLPTAIAFATRGVDVVGLDVNAHTVELINRGRPPFVEPDLAVAVSGAVAMGRLRATTAPEPADAFVVAVPTPFRKRHAPDTSCIRAAAKAIAPVMRSGNLVVLESTSPPGTTRQLAGWLAAERPDLTFPDESGNPPQISIAHCPERVLPGRIIIEMVTNDRIIGGLSGRCAERARDLYQTFAQGEIHLTDATTAEMTKLTENAYRDVNIAFANELSLVCDRVGVDVWDIIQLANHHPRVNILSPGPGVGGHCIAVDPWFIVQAAPKEARLMRLAREINDAKPAYVINEVSRTAERFRDPAIACLGLTFKANVDDLRESPALHIATELAQRNVGRLLVAEPHIDELPPALIDTGNAKLVDAADAIAQADIIVALVDHDVFRRVKSPSLRGKVVFDTRGIWR